MKYAPRAVPLARGLSKRLPVSALHALDEHPGGGVYVLSTTAFHPRADKRAVVGAGGPVVDRDGGYAGHVVYREGLAGVRFNYADGARADAADKGGGDQIAEVGELRLRRERAIGAYRQVHVAKICGVAVGIVEGVERGLAPCFGVEPRHLGRGHALDALLDDRQIRRGRLGVLPYDLREAEAGHVVRAELPLAVELPAAGVEVALADAAFDPPRHLAREPLLHANITVKPSARPSRAPQPGDDEHRSDEYGRCDEPDVPLAAGLPARMCSFAHATPLSSSCITNTTDEGGGMFPVIRRRTGPARRAYSEVTAKSLGKLRCGGSDRKIGDRHYRQPQGARGGHLPPEPVPIFLVRQMSPFPQNGRLCACPWLLRFPEPIPHAADGFDGLAAVVADFGAKAADVDVDRANAADIVGAPNAVENGLAGKGLVGI